MSIVMGFTQFAFSINAPAVSAANASDWNASRIIDDPVFFNPDSVSSQDIQYFLNAKMPACDTNGQKMYNTSQTRAQWAAANGKPQPPYTCLKDYSQNIPGIGPDAYCGGSVSAGFKSAATIIKEVAVACGINPHVILVTLQKEQSLITDDWPWPVQYTKATGMGCPDTSLGVDVDANQNGCYDEYEGFFKQIYYGARQFQRYVKQPDVFNYAKGRNSFVAYQANNPGCGGTYVTPQTHATAALYNYTPYQPNAAALNDLYGTGDACSAYGNRNFWRMYTDWFGSTQVSTPYGWSLVSQEAYVDSSRTIPFTSITTVAPGDKVYLRIKLKNIGFRDWNNTSLRLGTSNPRDRGSVFNDTTWINGSRPAQISEMTVAPSEIGTLDFVLKSPSSTGTYYEYFTPVVEGETWMRDIGMYYQINVVSPVTPSNTTRYRLNAGEDLRINDFILSPDTHSVLTMQSDGRAVLYSNYSNATWSNSTQATNANRLSMQTDGNLVLYSENGTAIWNSGTAGNPNSRLELQTDGNLVVYNQNNAATWSAGIVHTPDHLKFVNSVLYTGLVFPGQQLETANRNYKLIFQTDGNLVLYSPNRATWSSGTWGNPNAKLVMQGDGNLVIYNSSGKPIWFSNTPGHGRSFLVVQADGNLVLYKSAGQVTWTSHTAGKN